MALPSIDAFLELVNKSGVVDPTRLAAYVEKLRAAKTLPTDAAKLAGVLVRDAVLTQFQAQQLLSGKWKGFFIGKYKVLEKLGSGGMGTVYLAEHKFMKRRVAIKVLPKTRALEPSSLERFYREAKAIAALDHPNIVRAYDIDQDKLGDGGELHYLVMEYVDGSSLQDIVRIKGPLDCARAAHYIYQAANGLLHAHAVGLVHRDIKPGNLLVDRGGTIKILDMGLARFFNDEQDVLTKKYDENVLGTADYLAPEQALDSHSVDIRADIYSLGGTLYFMLTGRSPFGEGTVAQKLIWHQTRRPKPVRDQRPDVPEELVAVLEKMMAKAPADRFQTPADLVQALAPWAQCATAAPPESELPALSPAARTNVASAGDAAEGTIAVSPTAPTSLRKAGASTSVPGGQSPTVITEAPVPALAEAAAIATAPVYVPPATPPNGSSEIAGPPGAMPVKGLPPQRSRLADTEPMGQGPRPRSGDDFSWTAVTDTSEPSALADDTLKTSPQPTSRKSRKELLEKLGLSRRLLIILGACVGGLLVVGAGTLLVLALLNRGGVSDGRTSPQPPPPPPPDRNTLYVSKTKVGPKDFPSIREALERAESGDHIIVRDRETYDETLVLTPASGLGKRGVILEAQRDADGNAATLRATGPDPVLMLERVDDFTLKGFTLDGNLKCDDLVRVAGACPGARLENLRMRGFNRAGIRLDGCEGAKGREVTFRNCRIESTRDKGQRAGSAIAFGQPNKSIVASTCRSLIITECRFEGPFDATIRLGSQTLGVAFERNLFVANKGTGLLLPAEGTSPPLLRMTINANTFWDCQAALVLEQRARWDTDIKVSGNLFYLVGTAPGQGIGQTPPTVSPEDFKDRIKGEGNVHDPKSQPGNLTAIPTLQLKSLNFQLPTQSPSATDFLRYPKDSPLSAAGDKGAPVGALAPSQ